MKPFVEFYNGYKMPMVGLGMWQTTNPEELEAAVDEALKIGYRHFDTAYHYQNEEMFGRVLKKWFDSGKLRREELFITTKLPCIGMHAGRVEQFIKIQLEALQLSYVDLYLVHNPEGFQYVSEKELFPMKDGKILVDYTTDLEEIWKAMELQVDAGRAKSIGISNFNSKQIERVIRISRIRPANLQVELNVYFPQKPLREFCAKNSIIVCAYAPFGSPGRKEIFKERGAKDEVDSQNMLEDPVVFKVANKHKKTPGQVLLRFLVQQGITVIPKSTNPNRLKQNFEIFDFELDVNDMMEFDGLDKGPSGRTFIFNVFPGLDDHPEYPYKLPF